MTESNYTDDMHQTLTYWSPGTNDGLGGLSFAAPITLACRWQNSNVLFKNVQGKDVVSSAVVYPAQPLLPTGWLFLGTSVATDPRSVAGAQEIQQVGASPDLDDQCILNKAWL